MPSLTAPRLQITIDFAERLVHQLLDAARETGRESFIHGAKNLQAEIDAQASTVQPEH